ncbi:MAG: OmpA family protein [Candidatus Binatia bacterium]
MAAADDYELQGRWFGGVDVGVLIPLNAYNRFADPGGVINPFIGYKFFDDKDLQLNLGVVGGLQFFGTPSDTCNSCTAAGKGINDDAAFGLSYQAGPRLSLPWGPLELYGDWQVGGLSGLTSPSAITDTSWGFMTGGGINYNINENVGIGGFGRWQRWYQRSHGVGDVRMATAGLEVLVQQSPPAPPPPPAPPVAPPPPAPPMKEKIILRGVNFDFDKYNIRPDAVPILEQACATLKSKPNINVSCQGHTDSVGTEQYNQGLSDRRANAVRNWLVKCGIPASRLTAKGFGEANPVASNETAEGRAQNRRTELVIQSQ